MIFAVLALVISADQPRLIGSVRVTTGFPDLIGASVTVHAIPYVDVEGAAALVSPAWLVRAGPRYLLVEAERFTVRVAALFGYKAASREGDVTRGFHFAGTVDFTWWLAAHVGIGLQVAGGGTYDGSRTNRKMLPDLRAAVGLSF